MRLEPLYRLRFRYPEAFGAGDELLLFAEGRAEGRVVAAIVHSADGDHAWLDGVLGVAAGEVRGREIVLHVAEVVWEPLGLPA